MAHPMSVLKGIEDHSAGARISTAFRAACHRAEYDLFFAA